MFALQNAPLPALDMPGIAARALDVEIDTARFDLEFNVWETASGLDVRLTYDTDLYEPATIDRLLEGYRRVLQRALEQPASRVSELIGANPTERRRTLVEWNATRTSFPRDAALATLFEAQAERAADRIALIHGQQRWTFAQLNATAELIARRLARLGVGPETPVGICGQRSMCLVAGLVGILKAGGAYVPLDLDAPPSLVGSILEETGAPVVLVDSKSVDLVNASIRRMTRRPSLLDLQLIEQVPDSEPVVLAGRACRGDSLACVMYTSGSTGQPKGIAVVHRAIARLVLDQSYVEFAEQVFLQAAPLAFDASSFEIWGSLLNGSTLALAPAGLLSLADLEQTLKRNRVTTAWLNAELFRLAADQRPEIFSSLRQLVAGGDVVSTAAVRKFLHVNPDAVFVNGYGPTENTTFTCCHQQRFTDPLVARLPIGRPINNTQVYVLDDGLNPMPIGVPGELCMAGDGLARGYWHNPSSTAERFVPHPFSDVPGARMYRSGDRAQWNPDGTLDFLGRRDRQLKVRGFRIEPGEIEFMLRSLQGVEEAVVAALAGPDGEKRLVAWLQYQGETRPTRAELRQSLVTRLSSYMVPSEFVFVDKLPRTAAGKVDLPALCAASEARHGTDAPGETASPSLLQQVAAEWRSVLGHRQVGLDDNFFDIGGHSLLLVELHHRLQTRLAPTLSIVDLFGNPTIRTQAQLISAGQTSLLAVSAET
ncbi:MAG TPA: amino acid adenylation domain-containing protein, partial [Pirellulales bacterium]|nr:amino acid adenylation domain-containing protein [Pirellulales bacterium]